MTRVALIVEGKGDVKAVPSLVAKTAAAFDRYIIVSDPPIKAGEALKLKRPGELERHIRLAMSRDDIDEILIIVDLDDGCPKEFFQEFSERTKPLSDEHNKPVHICFLVREYETLFLADIENIRTAMPELGIPAEAVVDNPHIIRGAKEHFKKLCRERGYKQTRDQLTITKKLNVFSLGLSERSFRKLIKCITELNYEEIVTFCEAKLSEA